MTMGWVRGACPSLSAPMPTGDGLLVRMTPRGGTLTPTQLAGIAEASGRFGNGAIEITARGSLQIRGLADRAIEGFGQAIAALGIEAEGAPEIRAGPLAGLDSGEIADPRPLADEIRRAIEARGLAARLAAKVSLVVDGGGALPLVSIAADVRLEALQPSGTWRVCIGRGGTESLPLGQGSARDAAAVAIALLELLEDSGPQAHARDLDADDCAALASSLALAAETWRPVSTSPVGVFPLRDGTLARGFALPFGQIDAGTLRAFILAIEARALRLAPARGLLVLGLSQAEIARIDAIAETHSLVTDADDLRLRIAACAGAPSCASAHLPTKSIAQSMVEQRPDLLVALPALHISGCGKQCARPAGPALSLIGGPGGSEIVDDRTDAGDEIRALLTALALGPVDARRRRHA